MGASGGPFAFWDPHGVNDTMSAAVMSAVTVFEFLVNCLFGIVPMRWSNLSMAHPEKKGAKPDKRAATKSKSNIRRPIVFRPELLELFKVSAPTIWIWQVKHNFPRPIVVAGRQRPALPPPALISG